MQVRLSVLTDLATAEDAQALFTDLQALLTQRGDQGSIRVETREFVGGKRVDTRSTEPFGYEDSGETESGDFL